MCPATHTSLQPLDKPLGLSTTLTTLGKNARKPASYDPGKEELDMRHFRVFTHLVHKAFVQMIRTK